MQLYNFGLTPTILHTLAPNALPVPVFGNHTESVARVTCLIDDGKYDLLLAFKLK